MPVWLATILLKYALPLVISELAKSGVLKPVQVAAIKGVDDLVTALGGVKTYSSEEDFPHGKNGA